MDVSCKAITARMIGLGKPYLLQSSAIDKDRLLRIVKRLQPSVAIEIGTYRGLSALVLSSICEHVHTFDLAYQSDAEWLWQTFGVDDRISYHVPDICFRESRFIDLSREELGIILYDKQLVAAGRKDIAEKVAGIDFDFAFVDGQHTYENVKADFEMVRRCGCVLFHDNRSQFPGVQQFVKEITAEPLGEFALWCCGKSKWR